ncbi:dynactin subunit 2 [Copidosoma floridanum]|uniref:dynactin subunit 2 n=1 Tax=Copidosoma floridanum TaxID=29053 RepID=UPI000C6FA164|nr:dynactin subunit 2 [Copidosoma floridanum]
MIDPKYANLPGVANDQPDVFETEDPPENNDTQIYLQEDGASVEKIYLNASEAFMKFKEKHISAESLHFSDTACSSMQKYTLYETMYIDAIQTP